jgi:DNA polymerase-1
MSINGLHRYGIISYGLDWSLEEAAAQRDGWFNLYPEIQFWQCWSKLTYRTWPKREWVRKGYDKVSAASKTPLFKSKTLSGRPIFTTDSRKLLNYQDQGTGADIAMAALANLGWLTTHLRAFVHDEIVLEVPVADVEKAVTDLERIMCESAAPLLEPVGIEVETAVGDWWIH